MRSVKKYGRTRQGTDDNITSCMRICVVLTTAALIQSEYLIFIAFPLKSGYAKKPQCYVTRTLPVLLFI